MVINSTYLRSDPNGRIAKIYHIQNNIIILPERDCEVEKIIKFLKEIDI